MKVKIQGKQMKVRQDLQAYVYEHLVTAITRFYDNDAAELRVEFGDVNGPRRGNDMECHLTFFMPGASTIQIESLTQDPFASLDDASDRLIRVVKRELERMRQPGAHRREHPLVEEFAEPASEAEPITTLAAAEGVPGGEG